MPLINWAAIDWVSLVALSLLVLFVGAHWREVVVWQSHVWRDCYGCAVCRRLRGLVLRP
jgi:hypothetical protein